MENKFYHAFEKHVPHNVVHYCYDLWVEHGFQLRITKSRTSKFGDYRFDPADKSHTISVNHDLNAYAFLVTYIHEVAHLVTYKKHGSKVPPHGKEWKINFRELLLPLCNDLVFPAEVIVPLRKYLMNPKASSCGDPALYKALRMYDKKTEELGLTHLSDLKAGTIFIFNQRKFQKEAKRRTRSLCKELPSGRKYLIADIALVKVCS
jgi:SprT protein